MPRQHEVVQGEHISRLAEKYGFADFRTLWNHAGNSSLKQLRKNPNVLFPGDTVVIPDKELKKEACQTTRIHRFVVPVQSLKLRIVVKDFGRKPVANAPCTLEVEGSAQDLTTDGNGQLERDIQRSAEIAKLTLPRSEYSVKIGHLDPVEETSGVIARLNNLGYYVAPESERGEDEVRSAIEEFQRDHDLVPAGGRPSGVADEPTRAKLKEAHGC